MRPPFTVDEFFGVFAQYNESIWPMQLVLMALGVVAVWMAYSRAGYSSAIVTWILALLWAWSGLVYHLAHFADINQPAYLFGALFLLQAALFAWCSRPGRLSFRPSGSVKIGVGWILIVYALIIYPALNRIAGHTFFGSPTFGAPCPTTIFTFGLLYFARSLPRYLLVVPIIWAIIGSSAAFYLDVLQDLGLLVAGVAGVVLLFWGGGTEKHHSSA